MPYAPQIDAEKGLSRWAPWLGAAAFIGAIALYWQDASDPPANVSAFGCFTSHNRPAILIDSRGLNILGTALEPVPFRLDWNDEGIFLWPQQKLSLHESDANSYFELTNDVGNAFVFVKVVNGTVYGDTDETNLDTFQILNDQQRLAAYHRVDPSKCDAN